ncbi:murein hydrolase activator EnvC family protein [Alkalisalibacterium limincola]|uniref:Peptidase M23 n=1 Tax=Alkalisalibacterium limincola TaxID=2699169 RepID=A0A5C8KTY9_9GAMM|nr:hypothetical protein [Alkalisalibacterium limincola]TXK64856.1 hypothetical protein FU658_03185 [Alkalisalibacterium limincola]
MLALLVPLAGLPAQTPQSAQERAREEARAEGELERIRSELRELAEAQQRLEGQRSSASQALREADAAVGTAVRGLRDTEAGIATQEGRLRELEAEASALETRLSGQREALAALVRSAYALGRHEQLKLLLAQDRIGDLARVLAYHRYVQEDRSERIRGLLDELQVLAELSEQVRERRTALAASQLRQQQQLAELEAQRGERAGVVAELEARHQAGAERIAALGRDQEALGKLLEQLRDVLADVPRQLDDATPLSQRRGQLPWPLMVRGWWPSAGRCPTAGRPRAG